MTSCATSRLTRQRKVILEELKKVTTHPTADELYRTVRKRLPRISLGTVYRNLDLMSQSGLIQRLELCGAQKRFDGDTSDHYHKRCLGCGRVDDVRIERIPAIEKIVKRVTDYEIVGHRVEFMGFCPECRKRKSGRRARAFRVRPDGRSQDGTNLGRPGRHGQRGGTR